MTLKDVSFCGILFSNDTEDVGGEMVWSTRITVFKTSAGQIQESYCKKIACIGTVKQNTCP